MTTLHAIAEWLRDIGYHVFDEPLYINDGEKLRVSLDGEYVDAFVRLYGVTLEWQWIWPRNR